MLTRQAAAPEPAAVGSLIAAHLQTIPENAEVEVAFFGGNFTALPLHRQLEYLSAVRPFLETGRVCGIRFSTRPDCIFPEQLSALYAAGVRVIELGVQSFADEVLAASRRGYTPDTARTACRRVKEAGFALGVQLMPGLPGDDRAKALASVQETINLQADMVRIYPTLVLEGTELAEHYRAGLYQPLTLEAAVELVKELALALAAADIAVIRMGLQAGVDLAEGKGLVAGPYHPAFGELVEQSIFLTQALTLAASVALPAAETLRFFTHPRDLSKLIGCRRAGVRALEKNLRREVQVRPHAAILERDTLGAGGGEVPEVWLSRQKMINLAPKA
jgi:histone acetyltransferase (RNA polymerase elongator complex component)